MSLMVFVCISLGIDFFLCCFLLSVLGIEDDVICLNGGVVRSDYPCVLVTLMHEFDEN